MSKVLFCSDGLRTLSAVIRIGNFHVFGKMGTGLPVVINSSA